MIFTRWLTLIGRWLHGPTPAPGMRLACGLASPSPRRPGLGLWFTVSVVFQLFAVVPVMSQEQASYRWQPHDESQELLAQAGHPNPRMQYRLLDSRLRDKNALWDVFAADLTGFSEAHYESLKPLILERDIPSLQRAIAEGSLSYEKLVQFYLYRLRLFESSNQTGLNAVIATNPQALAEARLRDRAVAAGLQVEPHSMFGIPVLLKDNIGASGMPTTAGAAVLMDNLAADAFLVRRLRANGAVILGKANLSEWAYFFCDGCPLGYSAVGGQTFNPYGRMILESGGSSSGSAVAVAANLAPVAVGSETSGSILSPAGLNSIVGLKPTTGMLSRTGIVPISSSLDTAGPMAKTVTDAVILFNAMTGFDRMDDAMPMQSVHGGLMTRASSLAGRRLGYFANLADDAVYQAGLEALRAAGAVLVEVEMPEPVLEGFVEFLGAEMKLALEVYLRTHANAAVPVRNVEGIVAFNQADAGLRAPYGQSLLEAMLARGFSPGQVDQLREQLRAEARQLLAGRMVTHDLDALVSLDNRHAAVAALANYPALSVPAGFREDGTPAGLTFIAASFGEQELVDLGQAFETLYPRRRAPENYQ